MSFSYSLAVQDAKERRIYNNKQAADQNTAREKAAAERNLDGSMKVVFANIRADMEKVAIRAVKSLHSCDAFLKLIKIVQTGVGKIWPVFLIALPQANIIEEKSRFLWDQGLNSWLLSSSSEIAPGAA